MAAWDDPDLLDTAQIVLLEMQDAGENGYAAFSRRVRHEEGIGLVESAELYRAFMGWDGRVRGWLNVNTRIGGR